MPLYLRTANSYDGKGSHRIFIPYFQLLIQINTYKIIPDFLMRYYKDFPNSYIVNKDFIHSGTLEYQKEQTNVLKELGFDIGNLL